MQSITLNRNKIFRNTALIFLTAIIMNSCEAPGGTSHVIIGSAAKARIDSTLRNFVDSGKVAGVSALISEKGKEVYFNAFGYANREAGVPMSRNTIVQLFSMTKPITGVALMTLYEKGAFQLDDPVSDYVPEFSNLSVATGLDASGSPVLEKLVRPMTIRDLTRHTSGLANSNDIPVVGPLLERADPTNINNTLKRMVEIYGGLPLYFQPGTQWSYGPSVDVQAYLVERLSGMKFDAYMKEHILDPLKMTETRYFVPESDIPRLAALYNRNDETGVLTHIPDEQAFAFNTGHWAMTPGSWGLTSTIDNYMNFARMLVNEGTFEGNRVLKPETVRLMATNQLSDSIELRSWLPSKGQVGFGIDFAVRLRPPAGPDENNGTVGEFFWDGAASTLFWVDPVNELTAVLFVQLLPFDRVGLHRKFREAIYGPYNPLETD